ncbi:hypothetical protein B0H19DRAFT_1066798 [Mycena capillaripes]|nr:hypothetical protein B0H19DRAFT_1066798 [Mycena capillaripes]
MPQAFKASRSPSQPYWIMACVWLSAVFPTRLRSLGQFGCIGADDSWYGSILALVPSELPLPQDRPRRPVPRRTPGQPADTAESHLQMELACATRLVHSDPTRWIVPPLRRRLWVEGKPLAFDTASTSFSLVFGRDYGVFISSVLPSFKKNCTKLVENPGDNLRSFKTL